LELEDVAKLSEKEKLKAARLAVRSIINNNTGFGALALFVEIRLVSAGILKTNTSLENFVAATNGKHLFLGDKFFTFNLKTQSGILVHEILHVAFQHCYRAGKMKALHEIYNIAADAVINEAISTIDFLSLPTDTINIRKIIPEALLKTKPANQWSTEQVYKYLLDNNVVCANCGGSLGTPKDGKKKCSCTNGMGGDLLAPEGSEAEQDQDQAVWNERLKRASRGDEPGGILRKLESDQPSSQINWVHLLRRFMTIPLLQTQEIDYSRPSRTTLALDGVCDYFDYAHRDKEGLPWAGIAVDTSGSIDQVTLEAFAAEIEAIQKQVNCNIFLVSCDAAVQTQDSIKNDGKSFRQKMRSGEIKFKGGGGTSFVPVLELMEEKKVKVLVYLTDMYGDFGLKDKWSFKTVWCATSNVVAPFGKTIPIGDPHDYKK
jgi:predicted metal-dependent peptidase